MNITLLCLTMHVHTEMSSKVFQVIQNSNLLEDDKAPI